MSIRTSHFGPSHQTESNFSNISVSTSSSKTKSKIDENEIEKKLSRYKLATDASFKDKLSYVIYRIWNAIKSIVNRSDWQLTRKEMFEEVKKQFESKDFKPFAEMLKDHMPQVMKVAEKATDLFMCFFIDSKINSYDKNDEEIEKKAKALIKPLFEEFKTHATKLSIDPELIDPLLEILENDGMGKEQYFAQIGPKIEPTLNSLLGKLADGSLVPVVADLAMGIFKIVAAQNLVDSATKRSAANLLSELDKALKVMSKDKALVGQVSQMAMGIIADVLNSKH